MTDIKAVKKRSSITHIFHPESVIWIRRTIDESGFIDDATRWIALFTISRIFLVKNPGYPGFVSSAPAPIIW